MKGEADGVLRRMETLATKLGPDEDWTECPYPQATRDGKTMRWKLSPRWIEFECGCTAERIRELVGVQRWDPIIFVGLPEQAIYEQVCPFHEEGVYRTRLAYGPYKTFDQWKTRRRRRLMQKAG